MGSLPDAHECLVDLEHIRKVLGALRSEVVAANTENNGNLASMASMGFMASMASMGANGVKHSQSRPNGGFDSIGSILEDRDASVDFESFRQVLCAL